MYFIFTIHASIRSPKVNIIITNTPAIYCIKRSWNGLGVRSLLPRRTSKGLRSNASQNWTAGDRGGSTTSKNAKYASWKCKDSSLTNPSTFEKGCEHVPRKGPSTFENMPLLHVEEALLGARKAYSHILSVTF